MTNFKILLLLPALIFPMMCRAKAVASTDTISARRAFLEFPASQLEILSQEERFNMLAYFDNDSIVEARNNLVGSSKLVKVTPDFLEARLTDVSTLQLKILKDKGGADIVMAIYTVGAEGDASDSKLMFFDSRLNPLPTEKYFPTPAISTFFKIPRGYKTSMKEIEEIIPFYSVVYTANPLDSNLKGRIVTDDILTIEDLSLVEMFVLPSVTFTWNGKEFKLSK